MAARELMQRRRRQRQLNCGLAGKANESKIIPRRSIMAGCQLNILIAIGRSFTARLSSFEAASWRAIQ
jgi:hypothetical protein